MKKKSVSKQADPVVEEPAPVEEVVSPYEVAAKKCIKMLDPRGVGHVPGGSPGVLQDVLETLNAAEAGE